MKQTRVNAMAHPAYKTWPLRQRLLNPEVRSKIQTLGLMLILTSLFVILYSLFSATLFVGIQSFQSHYAQQQEDKWRNKAAFFGRACNQETTHFIVIDCNRTHNALKFNEIHTAAFHAIRVTTERMPPTRLLLYSALGCDTEEGWCMTATAFLISILFSLHDILLAGWWLSISIMILHPLCRMGVAHAWGQLRTALDTVQPTTKQMTKDMQAEFVNSIAQSMLEPSMPDHSRPWISMDQQSDSEPDVCGEDSLEGVTRGNTTNPGEQETTIRPRRTQRSFV